MSRPPARRARRALPRARDLVADDFAAARLELIARYPSILPARLVCLTSREDSSDARHIDTAWFVELDSARRPVRQYRCWIVDKTDAPGTRQIGIERYTPNGRLIDREVRRALPPKRHSRH